MPDTKTTFADISTGESLKVSLLVLSVGERLNKNNDPFLVIQGSDASHSPVDLKIWNHGIGDADFEPGDVITSEVKCALFNDSLTYTASDWVTEGPDHASDFTRSAPVPVDEMWEWVENRIEHMREPYKTLASYLVSDNKRAFCHAAAGKSIHHAYASGLLYHSYRMARAADALAGIYGADADLCACGALLHDIGKLREMETDALGLAEYTVPGQLLGHLYLGCEMVREVASDMGEDAFEGDELLCLLHIIASHHGENEHGAIKVPATKEAMIVSMVDMLDMKASVYDEQVEDVEPGAFNQDARSIIGRAYRPLSAQSIGDDAGTNDPDKSEKDARRPDSDMWLDDTPF